MHIIPQEPTTAGYEKVLTKSPFFKWLWNSCFVTGINTIVILFTSSIVGYIFARFNFKGRNFLFAMLLFTMMVPAQVTMITTFIIIDGVGLYNSVWALIIPSFVNVFGIYLCKQYCEEIPKELIESAKIDGAGNFRIYWNIVIPQIRPALGALAIFTFLEYWNDYLNPLIYLSSTDNMTLPLALSYFSTQHSTDLSATMAASALIMIPATIVFIIFQKQFIKGLALTGMK
jgi:ABC-type glycerol-3-phosphate transport system permease component